jgi:hypothetical protein
MSEDFLTLYLKMAQSLTGRLDPLASPTLKRLGRVMESIWKSGPWSCIGGSEALLIAKENFTFLTNFGTFF